MFSFTVQVSTIQEKISALDTAEACLMGFSSPLIRESGYVVIKNPGFCSENELKLLADRKFKATPGYIHSGILAQRDWKGYLSSNSEAKPFLIAPIFSVKFGNNLDQTALDKMLLSEIAIIKLIDLDNGETRVIFSNTNPRLSNFDFLNSMTSKFSVLDSSLFDAYLRL